MDAPPAETAAPRTSSAFYDNLREQAQDGKVVVVTAGHPPVRRSAQGETQAEHAERQGAYDRQMVAIEANGGVAVEETAASFLDLVAPFVNPIIRSTAKEGPGGRLTLPDEASEVLNVHGPDGSHGGCSGGWPGGCGDRRRGGQEAGHYPGKTPGATAKSHRPTTHVASTGVALGAAYTLGGASTTRQAAGVLGWAVP